MGEGPFLCQNAGSCIGAVADDKVTLLEPDCYTPSSPSYSNGSCDYHGCSPYSYGPLCGEFFL